MKATINGNRYNSESCEKLAERYHYSHGNCSGMTVLLRAKNGEYLEHTDTNGEDLYLRDLLEISEDIQEFLNFAAISDEQEARLVELGLLKIV